MQFTKNASANDARSLQNESARLIFRVCETNSPSNFQQSGFSSVETGPIFPQPNLTFFREVKAKTPAATGGTALLQRLIQEPNVRETSRQALEAWQENPNSLTNDRYRTLKHRLPCVCPAILDGDVSAENVRGFDCVAIEFDSILHDSLAEVWNAYAPALLQKLPETMAALPSGRGVRLILAVTPFRGTARQTRNAYAQAFDAALNRLIDWCPLLGEPDPTSRRAVQKHAIWARPDLQPVINHEPRPLEIQYSPELEVEDETKANWTSVPAFDEFKATAEKLIASGNLPFVHEYVGWAGVMAAIANVYGSKAIDIAEELAALAPGYGTPTHRRHSRAYFESVLRNQRPDGKAGFGTIAKAFAEAGFRFPSARKIEAPKRADEPEPLRFQRYLTEISDQINDAIIQAGSGIPVIQAEPGRGKTKLACDLLKAKADANTNNVHLFIVPYADLAKAIALREDLPYIRQGVTVKMLKEDLDGGERVFVCTPDAVDKMKRAGGKITSIVIDEIHDWPNAISYRKAAAELLCVARKTRDDGGTVIGLTATPQTALVMGLGAYVANVRLIKCEAETHRTRKLLAWNVGSLDDLLLFIIDEIAAGRRTLLHIDKKTFCKYGKSVPQIAETLRKAGINVKTALAGRTEGLRQFQNGDGDVLIGTRLICNGFDIPAKGRNFTVIQACMRNGIEPEALVQLGGRPRDAEEVRHVLWAFGKGKALKAKDRFSIEAAFNGIKRQAEIELRAAAHRSFIPFKTLTPAGRMENLRETDSGLEVNPLALIHASLKEQANYGGLQAFIAEIVRYAEFDEPPAQIDWTPRECGSDKSEFDRFLKASLEALARISPRCLIAVALSREANKRANQLPFAPTAWKNDFPALEDPENELVRLARLSCLKLADDAGKKAEALSARIQSEKDKAKRRSLRTEVKNLKATQADFQEAAKGFDRWADLWLIGAADLLDEVCRLLNALPDHAKPKDATRLLERALQQGKGQLGKSTLRRARTQFATALNLDGGVTSDIPAEALHGLEHAIWLERAAAVREALIPLIRDSAGGLTGEALTARVREYTGLECLTVRQALAMLRAVAEVQTVALKNEKGEQTTGFVIVRACRWEDFGQSYDPKAAVEAAVERGRYAMRERGITDFWKGSFKEARVCLFRPSSSEAENPPDDPLVFDERPY